MGRIKKQSINDGNLKILEIQQNAQVFEYPVFSFKQMRNGKYHIDKCEQKEKSSLALKMSKIGQCTWQELRLMSRHKLGFEKISKRAITGDSINFLSEDVNLIAFRFFGKAPMVGYKCSNGAFHILWLDRDFTLYKHSK